MRPPSPEPVPWSVSRATPPFVPSHLMDAGEVVSSYHELWHARAVLSDEQARPEGPPRLPPHPRRHRGSPDRGDGLPGRSPLPPGGHLDQHRQDRARATRPAGGHHQPQRPPNHRSAPAHPNRNQHPQIPTDHRALRRHESGHTHIDPRNNPL